MEVDLSSNRFGCLNSDFEDNGKQFKRENEKEKLVPRKQEAFGAN